ncbi:MAG: hypothetical protein JSR90_05955 [Proteobacteria bacterium]|nr:hypothetical protein [Pseudomonadota bacterium]
MEIYPVDTDPEQVIRWLMVERARGAYGLQVTASRISDSHGLDESQLELGLGDEEREDLSEEVTIAQLEIAPLHTSEGWRLTVSVEDELHPSESEEEEEEEEEDEIDLDTFYLEFIRPGHGTVSVIAEVDGPDGVAHLDRLLKAIETNTHVPEGQPNRRNTLS